jgi:hypothetical protein
MSDHARHVVPGSFGTVSEPEHDYDDDAHARYSPTADYVESVLHAYLVTVLWSSVDKQDTPLDARYSPSDVDPESVDRARSEVVAFLHDNRDDLTELSPDDIGHNFALTRDHHGAGFWDMGLGERGDRLTAASHPYGDTGAYVGDDGQVYLS